jgi:predicted transcriptional regulator
MPEEHRVTIRLSPELYAQLDARGRQGQPMAAIVRQALMDYLARQPEQPRGTDDLAEMVAAMAARLQDLQDQLASLTARVDAMAATWQLMAASDQLQAAAESSPAAERQPEAANTSPPSPLPAQAPAAEWRPMAARGQQQRRPPTQHGLPDETLQAIAEERTHCEGLSLRDFAQRLHARGIYSARAKDGSPVPANAGNVKKWLDQARAAGLL